MAVSFVFHHSVTVMSVAINVHSSQLMLTYVKYRDMKYVLCTFVSHIRTPCTSLASDTSRLLSLLVSYTYLRFWYCSVMLYSEVSLGLCVCARHCVYFVWADGEVHVHTCLKCSGEKVYCHLQGIQRKNDSLI
jgi:hypothetical protein